MKPQQTANAVGIFEDRKQAVEAVRALLAAHFPAKQITLVARDWRDPELAGLGIEEQHAAASGAVQGAAVGGGVGIAAGLLTLLVPGIGPAAVAIIALAGAAGAAAGAFFGPFIAMEMTEAEAREHAAHVEQGRTVVVVRVPDRHDEAQAMMVSQGAYDFSMSTD